MYAEDGRTENHEKPWDQVLSTKLDIIQCALDDQPSPVRRAVLNIQRRWYTRDVPAQYGGEVRHD